MDDSGNNNLLVEWEILLAAFTGCISYEKSMLLCSYGLAFKWYVDNALKTVQRNNVNVIYS